MLAKAGADVYVTCKWCSVDEEQLAAEFRDQGARPPVVVQADAAANEDTDRLLDRIAEDQKRVDIFVSNVAFALRTPTLKDYKLSSLHRTLDYSTWPLIEYTRRIQARFGSYPRYILGISSDGPDHFYRGYDFMAAGKALLEYFGRCLSVHLMPYDCRVNILRFGPVDTDSFRLIFGATYFEYMHKLGIKHILTVEECGRHIYAFCSGMLDAINGQVIAIDYGYPFQDNQMMAFLRATESQQGVEPEGNEKDEHKE